MEKDLEKDIRRVAQAERLSEEEQLHGDNIAGTFEVNEDIEDKYELITKLRKKLKVWRGILIAGFIVLLIILLYMLYIYRGSKEPTPVPEPDPVFAVNQEVTTITVNLEDKLDEWGLSYTKKNWRDGVTKYVLDQCPFNHEHKAPDHFPLPCCLTSCHHRISQPETKPPHIDTKALSYIVRRGALWGLLRYGFRFPGFP